MSIQTQAANGRKARVLTDEDLMKAVRYLSDIGDGRSTRAGRWYAEVDEVGSTLRTALVVVPWSPPFALSSARSYSS